MDTYHQDYASVSKTMLNLFLHSRQEFYLTYITREMPPWEPTKPALFGQVLHAMALEGVAFDDVVMPYPAICLNDNGGLIGARATAFRNEYPEFICMKHTECDVLLAAIDRVMKHAELSAVLANATLKERRVDAEIQGVKCKCKPDILCDLGPHIVIYDLKFSELVDPDSWRRTSRRLNYWLQSEHYSSVVSTAYDKPVVFRFCLIETKFPYRVQWKWLGPHSRGEAVTAHRQALRDLAECRQKQEKYGAAAWSDNWKPEMVVEPWDLQQDVEVEVEI